MHSRACSFSSSSHFSTASVSRADGNGNWLSVAGCAVALGCPCFRHRARLPRAAGVGVLYEGESVAAVRGSEGDAACPSAQRTLFAAAAVAARPPQTAALGRLRLTTAAGSVRGGGGVIIGASTLVGDCDGDVVHSFPSGLTSATLLGCALVRLVACFCFVRTGGTGSITLDSTLSRCMKWSRLALVGCLERMDGRSERFGQLSGFAGIENPTTPRAIAMPPHLCHQRMTVPASRRELERAQFCCIIPTGVCARWGAARPCVLIGAAKAQTTTRSSAKA